MQRMETGKGILKAAIMICLSSVFLYFAVFNLGNEAISNWDEARHGISAYEMMQSGNYICNTFNYAPDEWNLKPPLSFWAIAASFAVNGYTLLALRLPSCICLVLTFFLLSRRMFRSHGFISGCAFMLLFEAFGDLFFVHYGRSADADAIYILFFVCAMLLLPVAEQKRERPGIRYALAGLCASLAFLAKSFHAFTILAILVAYAVISQDYKRLGMKGIACACLCAAAPVLIWGAWRYAYDQWDFLGNMFGVDVINRIEDGMENARVGTQSTFFQYLTGYRPTQLLIILIIVCALIIGISRRMSPAKAILSRPEKRTCILLGLWIVLPFIMYSLSSTGCTWYYYPTIIALIVAASALLGKCISTLRAMPKGVVKKTSLAAFCAVLLCGLTYQVRMIGQNADRVRHCAEDKTQQALRMWFDRGSEYTGRNAYIQEDLTETSYRDIGQWEQADILAAELFADFRCQDGGIEGFLTDSGALLLVSRRQYGEHIQALDGKRVLLQNEEYLVFEN